MYRFRIVTRFAESRTRVRYAETDQMGIAHHANYPVWFEIGRTDLCRAAGVSYREIEDKGYLLVVSEIICRYRSPFRYDDEVVIRTSIAVQGSRAMSFAYQLSGVDGALRASGSSAHIWVDRESRRPVRAPQNLSEAFSRWRRVKSEG